MSEAALRIPGPGKNPRPSWHFLAESRLRLGLSQTILAELCGVRQSQISDWERGEYAPNMGYMSRLSKALNIPIGQMAEEAEKFFATNTT